MARFRPWLVIGLFLGACGLEFHPEFPRPIYVDSAFDNAEFSVVLKQISQVNALGQELLGQDLLVYAGRHDEPGGFRLDDFSDDKHVIYKVSRPDETYAYLHDSDEPGVSTWGYGTWSDVLIFTFQLIQVSAEGQYCFSADRTGLIMLVPLWSDGSIDYSRECLKDAGCFWTIFQSCDDRVRHSAYAPILGQIVLHELGHHIGLAHINDDRAVMSPVSYVAFDFAAADKREFCCIYECTAAAAAKYPCDLPQ